MVVDYICTSYAEKFNTLQQLILEGKNIYLYGNGNNGKTFILKQILQTLDDATKNSIHVCEADEQNYNLPGTTIGSGETALIQSNTPPPNGQFNTFSKVLFTGNYDAATDTYINFAS